MEFQIHKIKKKNKYKYNRIIIYKYNKYNKNKFKEFQILLSNLVQFTSDRRSSKRAFVAP